MNKRCTRCGKECEDIEMHLKNECNQDYFSIYNYAQLKDIDLEDDSSGLEVGDTVKLIDKCETLFGGVFGEKYKEINEENIAGKVSRLDIIKTHYQWGEYASVEWDNGWVDEGMHSSWLAKFSG